MNQATITKAQIKNGTLTLPQWMRKSWQEKEVVIIPEKDRFIIQSFEPEWDEYERKLSKLKKKIPTEIIDEAVNWARK